MTRRPWTKAEARRLAEMLRSGTPRAAVAEALQRTSKALKRGIAIARSMGLNVAAPPPAPPPQAPPPPPPPKPLVDPVAARQEAQSQRLAELARVHGQALVEGRARGDSWERLGEARGWGSLRAREVAMTWCATWGVPMPKRPAGRRKAPPSTSSAPATAHTRTPSSRARR